MRYPIWLLPIIAMTIMIAAISGKQKPWNECSPEERKSRIILLFAGIILVVTGVIVFFIVSKE